MLTSLQAWQLLGIFTLPCLYANICTALQRRILFKKHYVHCIIKNSVIYNPSPRKKMWTGLLPGYGATVVTLWNPLRTVPISSPMIVQVVWNRRRRGASCRLLSTDTLTPISCTPGHKAVLSATQGPRTDYIDVTIKLMVLECIFLAGEGAHLYTCLISYKREGCQFDPRWYRWYFSLTYSFRPHTGPAVDSASYRNEYQEYFLEGRGGRCVRADLTTFMCPLSWNLEASTSWKPQGPSGPVMRLLRLYLYLISHTVLLLSKTRKPESVSLSYCH